MPAIERSWKPIWFGLVSRSFLLFSFLSRWPLNLSQMFVTVPFELLCWPKWPPTKPQITKKDNPHDNNNITKISKWPSSGKCVQQTAQIGRSLLQGGGVGIKEQDWFKLRFNFKRGNDKLEIKIDLNFWTMHIMFRQARRLSLLAKKYNYNSVVLR